MKSVNAITTLLISERKKRNLTQKDMRMLIGMSQQQYQRIEAGQDIKVSTLLRVLAGLDLTLAIIDPSAEIKETHAIQNAEEQNFWSVQHKHLED